MEQINDVDYMRREDLIYWIDKWFVQEIAKEKIGRKLTDNELVNFTKMIEWGLWNAVYDTIKIAIDEVVDSDN